MSLCLGFLPFSSFRHEFFYSLESLTSVSQAQSLSRDTVTGFWTCQRVKKLSGVARCNQSNSKYSQSLFGRLQCFREKSQVHIKDRNYDTGDDLLLHVQTLRKFPVEKLCEEIVIVRFDSTLLLEMDIQCLSVNRTLSTIKYLYNAGAKILLVSNWGRLSDLNLLSVQSFADYLSSLLDIQVTPTTAVLDHVHSKSKEFEKSKILLLDNLAKFREELANCSDFARKLSEGAYIFVNDAFCLSHKILASTVGIPRFCNSSVAGFHFEEELLQLKKIGDITRQPYIAIIGGSKFLEKATALRLLASVCDGLIIVGKLAFQIMHALGVSIPSCVLEKDVAREALELIQLARNRNIPIYCPDDLRCVSNCNSNLSDIFPSDGIVAGWTPVDLGPMSLKKIFSLLSICKKVLWIGPVKFGPSEEGAEGETKLSLMLERISYNGCEITVVGNAACKAITIHSEPSRYKMFKSASVAWEFLHGRCLPGVAALDRVYPLDVDWNSVFTDPTQPLVVDIGSGNGLFILNMAKRCKQSNFLGLDINRELVKRCLASLCSGIKNQYFIPTNATAAFRSIISGYPGELVLVSIQCPNPDFNREEHRWRMVQRILVEAIVDLLSTNGKIFLQSDIEAVALRMKEQFLIHAKGKLMIHGGSNSYDGQGWLPENPFGVRSDWEQHVIDRGNPMYRVMLRKVGDNASNK